MTGCRKPLDRLNCVLWGSVLLIVAAAGSPASARFWTVAPKEIPAIASDEQVRTIAEAASRAQPGDTVVIHAGVYRESVRIDRSGSQDQPITIRAAEGQTVILTGADRITDWTKDDSPDGDVCSTPWPHKFVAWNEHHTHPGDEFHRLIGRCEQVFVGGYALRQVLERDKLTRGTFYIDLDAQRLFVCGYDDRDIAGNKVAVEASARNRILSVKGSHIVVQGLRFRYAANRAQQGAVEFAGNHIIVKDCTFEYTNASGAQFTGENITVRNGTFQHNGQLGFGASRSHGLQMIGCTVRNNNTRGFDRGWEAGGNKICLARGVILEDSTFVANRGNGIWFDIGNEDCVVRHCLIADNEDAGIFYEISYGLHAHDNVIVGNGLADSPGAWGAAAGISLSSSPGCTIERNLLIGNKEGFSFREQQRSTPKIDGSSEPVWNHDQIVRHNVLAFNRDAQVWGWFDIGDERHWPKATQSERAGDRSLADLNLRFENNLYCPAAGQGLFHWGVTWKRHERFGTIEEVQAKLGLGQGSRVAMLFFANPFGLDLRVPADSPAIAMGCYPRGTVPGVQLGIRP
jgi:parallel beta-helix repeat protein